MAVKLRSVASDFQRIRSLAQPTTCWCGPSHGIPDSLPGGQAVTRLRRRGHSGAGRESDPVSQPVHDVGPWSQLVEQRPDGDAPQPGGDLTVAVPDAKVLFTGDMLWRKVAPNLIDGSVADLTGFNLHWYAWGLASIIVSFVMARRGVDFSSKVLGVSLVLETLILVVFDISVLVQTGFDVSAFSPAAVLSGSPRSGSTGAPATLG